MLMPTLIRHGELVVNGGFVVSVRQPQNKKAAEKGSLRGLFT